MKEVASILNDLKQNKYKPVYFLMGEETFFIDQVAEYIQHNALQEHERDFNQTLVYGKDASITEIVATARRFPMMADRTVVIVREAQDLSRSIEQLADYVKNPTVSTVLVLCYKYKKIPKNKALAKAVKSKGVLLETKNLYESQVVTWTVERLKLKGYTIDPKAVLLLIECLGTNLSNIENELSKLQIILEKGTYITPDHIEENIGISKDYNVFELNKAIGAKNIPKARKISNYFIQNPKEKPIVVTVALLYNFFIKVMSYHGMSNKNERYVAEKLKVNPFFVKDYVLAGKNYPMRKVSFIIEKLREADLKSKGVNASSLAQPDILKELLTHIFS